MGEPKKSRIELMGGAAAAAGIGPAAASVVRRCSSQRIPRFAAATSHLLSSSPVVYDILGGLREVSRLCALGPERLNLSEATPSQDWRAAGGSVTFNRDDLPVGADVSGQIVMPAGQTGSVTITFYPSDDRSGPIVAQCISSVVGDGLFALSTTVDGGYKYFGISVTCRGGRPDLFVESLLDSECDWAA